MPILKRNGKTFSGTPTRVDTAKSYTTFTSKDAANPDSWEEVGLLASKEKQQSLFSKISTMFKNIRYLYKVLGNTDISNIGDGSITGGLSAVNENLAELNSDLEPKTGTVTSSNASVYLQRVKVKQVGKVVHVSFGVLSPDPDTTSSLTLSGVSLPSEQVDFPICDANIYGRGYVSTNGKIGIHLSGEQTGSNYVMCNFSYVVE